jgi:hypothetical protein
MAGFPVTWDTGHQAFQHFQVGSGDGGGQPPEVTEIFFSCQTFEGCAGSLEHPWNLLFLRNFGRSTGKGKCSGDQGAALPIASPRTFEAVGMTQSLCKMGAKDTRNIITVKVSVKEPGSQPGTKVVPITGIMIQAVFENSFPGIFHLLYDSCVNRLVAIRHGESSFPRIHIREYIFIYKFTPIMLGKADFIVS